LTMKIYLAGPLFTTAERDFNARLASELRKLGYEIWLPQESEEQQKSSRELFEKDLEGINWAEVVVANMDGRDPDSGTCWECGYAFQKIPVVLFCTDFRSVDELYNSARPSEKPPSEKPPSEKPPYNPMLTEAATERLNLPRADMKELVSRLDNTLRGVALRVR
jgi:hypothetical protein